MISWDRSTMCVCSISDGGKHKMEIQAKCQEIWLKPNIIRITAHWVCCYQNCWFDCHECQWRCCCRGLPQWKGTWRWKGLEYNDCNLKDLIQCVSGTALTQSMIRIPKMAARWQPHHSMKLWIIDKVQVTLSAEKHLDSPGMILKPWQEVQTLRWHLNTSGILK